MREFGETTCCMDFTRKAKVQSEIAVDPPVINHKFMFEIEEAKLYDRRSFYSVERAIHARGESSFEVTTMRMGRFKRYPDVILYPSSSEHCEVIL